MAVTVLYDADCGFCTATARLLERRASVSSTAIQSDAGTELLADLEPTARLGAFHVVSVTGERWTGGAALAPLARELPGGRALTPILELFPRVTSRTYDLVARNRHRLSRALGLIGCNATPSRTGSGKADDRA